VNKSVPTLLGIVIILLVVVLVVVVFNYRLMAKLGAGEEVVGTAITETLTGVDLPEEKIGVGEVLGSREPQVEAQPAPMPQPDRRGVAKEKHGDKRSERLASETDEKTE